jgi:hypothetical protein
MHQTDMGSLTRKKSSAGPHGPTWALAENALERTSGLNCLLMVVGGVEVSRILVSALDLPQQGV